MKLSQVTAQVVALLRQNPFLLPLQILSTVEETFNRKLETALHDQGLALVVTQTSGAPTGGKAPQLFLQNSVMVSVLENPLVNQTGRNCLQCVEAVLTGLHQRQWPAQRGLQNVLTVDTPAYEAGPLDGGLVVYFCYLKFLTVQPVHE